MKWEHDEKRGMEVQTPSELFKWNQLGGLYQWFTDTYAHLSLAELKEQEVLNCIKILNKFEAVEVMRMKKLYCMNCGAQIKGIIPNKCSCGAEFDLADIKNIKKIITSIIFFLILMSPLFILIHFGRQYLQASIILYTLVLILGIFWYRIVQTILIRLGLVTMTNIEIK